MFNLGTFSDLLSRDYASGDVSDAIEYFQGLEAPELERWLAVFCRRSDQFRRNIDLLFSKAETPKFKIAPNRRGQAQVQT